MLQLVQAAIASRITHESFLELVGRHWPKGSTEYKVIQQALDTVWKAFEDRYRETGELYFQHLLAVAVIVMEYMRVRDHEIIAAALLHDIIEDIDGWNQERIANEFSRRIANLVWWVTKPNPEDYDNDKSIRNRVYHEQLGRAPREALVIKLADRLHNMLTIWDGTTKAKRLRKVEETRNFYLPLAHREILLIHEIEAALNAIVEKIET